MKLKGKKELLDHLPDYTDNSLKLILLRVNFITITTLIVLFFIDLIPRYLTSSNWLNTLEPYLPMIGSAIAIFGGLRIVHQTWYMKETLLEQDKTRAFQKASKFLFTGIPIALGGLLHGFLPIIKAPLDIISIQKPVNTVTSRLATSSFDRISSILGRSTINFELYQLVFGGLFILLAFFTMIRTIQVFGIDTAALVYVYYPEDSKIIQHEIYSIVRNPLYVSIMVLGFGMVISRLSINSFGIYIIWWLGMLYHIHYVEDKELIVRFGEDFRKYQRNVPALLIRPKNWKKFLRFVLGKSI